MKFRVSKKSALNNLNFAATVLKGVLIVKRAIKKELRLSFTINVDRPVTGCQCRQARNHQCRGSNSNNFLIAAKHGGDL